VNTAFGDALVVEARDVGGNVVPGAAVSFNAIPASNGAGSDSSSTLTGSPSGQATFTPTANTIAGSYVVRASLGNGQSVDFALTNTADLAPGQVQLAIVAGDGQTAQVETSYALSLRVLVTDRYGNALSGRAVTFFAPLTDSSVEFNVSGTNEITVATDGDGIADSGIFVANDTAGPVPVGATIDTAQCDIGGIGAICTVGFSLENTELAPTSVTLEIVGPADSEGSVGEADAYPLRARVLDQFGNPVPGVSVTFVAPSSGASVVPTPIAVLTDAAGYASYQFDANTVSGSFEVSAVVSGAPSAAVVLENIPGAATSITLSSTTSFVVMPGDYSLMATVVDIYDNGVPGAMVAFNSLGAPGTAGIVQPLSDATDGNGVALVLAADNGVAGTFQVQACTGAVCSSAVSLENRVDGDDIGLTLAGDAVGAVSVAGGPVYSLSSASTSNTGPAPAEFVVGRLVVTRVGGIGAGDLAIEYGDPTELDCGAEWCPLPLTPMGSELVGSFGPGTGFPLVNFTSQFRTRYATGGRYTVDAWVEGVTTGSIYAQDSFSVDVAELLLDQTPAAAAGVIGTPVSSSTRLANIGTADLDAGTFPAPHAAAATPNDVNVLGRFTIDHATALVPADVVLEYLDGTTWTPIALSSCGDDLCGSFGPPSTGFPTLAGYDATTLFRTTFLNETGTYAIATQIVGIDAGGTATGVTYATASQSVTVGTGAAATIHAISGGGQSTVVNTAFGDALVVEARDVGGNVVPGAAVSFNAIPASNGAGSDSSSTLTGSPSGQATFTPTANTIAGSYVVRASLGNGQSVDFALTNVAGAATSIVYVSGDAQTATVGNAFADLQVRVVDAFGNAVTTPTDVSFIATTVAGATAIVENPASSDVTGLASASASANGTAGSYAVTATLGSSSVVFNLTNAAGSIAITDIRWADTGTASTIYANADKVIAYTTTPSVGVSCVLEYNGGSALPRDAGQYLVQVSCQDASLGQFGQASATLTIVKADSAITLAGGSFVYDTLPKPASVTNPNDAAYVLSYAGTGTTSYGPSNLPPTVVGSYEATLIVDDPNYEEASAITAALEITPASVTLDFGNLSQVYDGNPKSVSVTSTPAGVTGLTLGYAPNDPPVNAGSYTVQATLSNPNYVLGGTTSATLTITQATAQIFLSNLTQIFDGSPKSVGVATVPASLAGSVAVSYDGSATAPSAVGNYAVVASLTGQQNYADVSVNATMSIVAAAISQFVVDSANPIAGTAGAALPSGSLPTVRVLDTNGNGVAGVSILFELGADSGSATGLSATTDANGRATVGSWTLDRDAGSDTMTARVNGLAGLPTRTFTANGAESAGVSLSKTSATTEAQPFDAITYSIVVAHAAGPSNAAAVDILDALPDGLDVANASWLCTGSTNPENETASCDLASGSGDIDVTAAIPVGTQITITLTATVEFDAPIGALVNEASAVLTSSTDPDTSNNEDAHTVTISPLPSGPCSVFCDGFEGESLRLVAQAQPKSLGGGDMPRVKLPATLAEGIPQELLHATDADGEKVASLDVLRSGTGHWARLRHRDAAGAERFSAWQPLEGGSVGLDWALDFDGAVLAAGASGEIRARLAPGQALPHQMRSRHRIEAP
jgi:hypothetical protein